MLSHEPKGEKAKTQYNDFTIHCHPALENKIGVVGGSLYIKLQVPMKTSVHLLSYECIMMLILSRYGCHLLRFLVLRHSVQPVEEESRHYVESNVYPEDTMVSPAVGILGI
jgi:hypothetical protein